jgi:hypothetical protein
MRTFEKIILSCGIKFAKVPGIEKINLIYAPDSKKLT